MDVESLVFPPEEFKSRVEECVRLVGKALGNGEVILIHCSDGINRSGSVVTLIIALLITLQEINNGVVPRTTWDNVLQRAWAWWAQRRRLAGRSDDHHDYEQESRDALQRYFGFLDESDANGLAIVLSRRIQQTSGSLRRTKEIIDATVSMLPEESSQSPQSPSTSPSLQSTAVEPSRSSQPNAENSPRSNRTPRNPRRSRSRSPPRAVLLPRAKVAAGPRGPLTPARPKGSVAQCLQSTSAASSTTPWRQVREVREVPAVAPPDVWRRVLPGDWFCTRCGNHNRHWRGFCNGKYMTEKCWVPRDSSWQRGDWYCVCGSLNLVFRTRCNRSRCGLYRSEGEQQPPPR